MIHLLKEKIVNGHPSLTGRTYDLKVVRSRTSSFSMTAGVFFFWLSLLGHVAAPADTKEFSAVHLSLHLILKLCHRDTVLSELLISVTGTAPSLTV